MRFRKQDHYQKHLRNHFLFIAIIVIIFITFVGNLSVRYFFNSFLKHQTAENNLQIVESANALLLDESLNAQTLKALSSSNNVYLRLLDDNGNIRLESDASRGRGMGYGRMFASSGTNGLKFMSYPLTPTDNMVAYRLEIGRPSSFLSSTIESQFIYALNAVFIVALIVAAIFSVVYANYQAKKITTPISALIKNTALIENQHYQSFNPIHSEFIEINDLNHSLANLNNKLMHQDALRKRLSTDIAHELRNPLSILRSHIEAFVDGVWLPSEEKLLKCNDEILRLTRLIDELNELSVIENSLTLNLGKHDITETVSHVIESFEMLLEEKGIEVQFSEVSPVVLNYDEDRMTQVFVNLLSNAVKYSADNTLISIKVDDSHFEITDHGLGISTKDLPYIFERFYRSDESRSRKTGGLGIGLSVTKAICDAHQYELAVSSEIGKGSTFTIFFS